MEKLLVFMMILASTLFIWHKDTEIALMDRAYRTIQYGLEHAVHDAALNIEEDAVLEGKIIFQQSKAEEVLYQSIKKNLPVDSMLHPTSKVFIENPLLIREVIYLDEIYIDPVTNKQLVFPFTWEKTLSNGFNFNRAIFGPSIALIVDVQVKGSDKYEPFVVIQEYKK